jgi:hypothetical protein
LSVGDKGAVWPVVRVVPIDQLATTMRDVLAEEM